MQLENSIECVSGALGYSWWSLTHPIDNTVLCPTPLEAWSGMTDFGINIMREIGFGPTDYSKMRLSGMVSIWSEGTMIHEMTHGSHLMGNLWTGML